jgi:uncharacterized protein YbjT (DUF2867 family)
MSTSRPVLVVGASGRLGSAVVAELAARGRIVHGAGRNVNRIPIPAKAAAADVLDPASLRAACAGVDSIVMAAGAPLSLWLTPGHRGFRSVDYTGTVNLVEAARAEGVRRLVYVSVFAPEGFEGGPYVEAHREAAEAVRSSGLEHAVIQPTGFFSTFDAFLPFVRLGVMPAIGDGRARTNPIHEADLAGVVADALEDGEGDRPVGGPETFTRREILELAFDAAGRRPRFARLPDVMLRFNRAAVRPIDRRLAELMTFLDAVNRTDAVAPAHGTRRLADHFRSRV